MVYLRCTSRVHPEYVLFDTRGFGPRDPSQSSEILAAGCLGAKSLKSAPKNTQKTLVYFLTLENPKNSIWMDEHLKTDDKSGKQNKCWNFCGKGLLWSWTARVIGQPSLFLLLVAWPMMATFYRWISFSHSYRSRSIQISDL